MSMQNAIQLPRRRQFISIMINLTNVMVLSSVMTKEMLRWRVQSIIPRIFQMWSATICAIGMECTQLYSSILRYSKCVSNAQIILSPLMEDLCWMQRWMIRSICRIRLESVSKWLAERFI